MPIRSGSVTIEEHVAQIEEDLRKLQRQARDIAQQIDNLPPFPTDVDPIPTSVGGSASFGDSGTVMVSDMLDPPNTTPPFNFSDPGGGLPSWLSDGLNITEHGLYAFGLRISAIVFPASPGDFECDISNGLDSYGTVGKLIFPETAYNNVSAGRFPLGSLAVSDADCPVDITSGNIHLSFDAELHVWLYVQRLLW